MPLIKGVHRYTLNFGCASVWYKSVNTPTVSPHTLLCLPLLNLHFPHYRPKNFSKQPTASLTCSCLELLIVCPKPYVMYSPAQKASSLSKKSLKNTSADITKDYMFLSVGCSPARNTQQSTKCVLKQQIGTKLFGKCVLNLVSSSLGLHPRESLRNQNISQ